MWLCLCSAGVSALVVDAAVWLYSVWLGRVSCVVIALSVKCWSWLLFVVCSGCGCFLWLFEVMAGGLAGGQKARGWSGQAWKWRLRRQTVNCGWICGRGTMDLFAVHGGSVVEMCAYVVDVRSGAGGNLVDVCACVVDFLCVLIFANSHVQSAPSQESATLNPKIRQTPPQNPPGPTQKSA